MTSSAYDKPCDIMSAVTLDEVHGGDLAIGTSLQNWVSGEINAADVAEFVKAPGHAYLPFYAIHPNGWSALRKMQLALMDCYRIDSFEAASRYKCPYTHIEFWGLVPLGVLTKDAEPYRKAFTAPGMDRYAFEIATEESRETQVAMQLGEKGERGLGQVLSSVTMAMLGTGYTQGFLSYDGSNTRELVSVDFVNGDKLICAAWIWYGN